MSDYSGNADINGINVYPGCGCTVNVLPLCGCAANLGSACS